MKNLLPPNLWWITTLSWTYFDKNDGLHFFNGIQTDTKGKYLTDTKGKVAFVNWQQHLLWQWIMCMVIIWLKWFIVFVIKVHRNIEIDVDLNYIFTAYDKEDVWKRPTWSD